jgi:hypothetical protein
MVVIGGARADPGADRGSGYLTRRYSIVSIHDSWPSWYHVQRDVK